MAEDRMLNDEILLGLIKANAGGGGGGTTDYEDLDNLPKVNNVELKGNKSLSDLGIASAQSVENITNGESINNFAGVETALDGVATALATKQNATDNSLDTEAKTIVGAINEHEGDISSLKSGLTNLDTEVNGDATTYDYADVITIEDAVPANLAECSVKIEPVQDLHGQSAPYVGGAGKNKLPLVLADLKSRNTSGSWSGNVYTNNDVTFTCNQDDAGNITSVTANGLASAGTTFIVGYISNISGNYIFNGVTGGSSNTYAMDYYGTGGSPYAKFYSGDKAISLESETALTSRLNISEGYTCSNVTFYPMLRLSTESDSTFAPYTNLCPISGHTEVDVQRDGGKNLLNVNAPDVIVGKTVLSDGTLIEAARVNVSGYIYVKDSAVLTYTSKTYNGYGFNRRIVCYDENKQFLGTCVQTTDNPTGIVTITGTVLANTKYVRVPFARDDASAEQLEYGTQATPYEPYYSKTYTISLGDTIYGGTVDFDSGVMTVNRAIIDLSTPSYYEASTNVYATSNTVSNIKAPASNDDVANCLCENYEVVSRNGQTDFTLSVNVNGKVVIADSRFSTKTDFVNSLNGVHLCYELATPLTVQLTPQQIQLLKGQNTITASTGQISVTANGVSGSIGAVQEQVNEHEERIEAVEERKLKWFSIVVPANATEYDLSDDLPTGAEVVSVLPTGGAGLTVVQYNINQTKLYFASAPATQANARVYYY